MISCIISLCYTVNITACVVHLKISVIDTQYNFGLKIIIMKPRILSFCFAIFLAIFCNVSDAENILYISLTPSPSHNIWDKTLAMALLDKGHKITYVTHSPEKAKGNFSVIIFEGIFEKLEQTFDLQDMVNENFIEGINLLFSWVQYSCVYDIETKGLQTLLKQDKDGVKYDLILYDITCTQCLLPLLSKFGAPPAIAVSAFGLYPFILDAFGADTYPAYIPNYALDYPDEMNFFQRLTNVFVITYIKVLKEFIYWPAMMDMARKTFGDNIEDLSVYERRFSLFLSNYDPVFNSPQPLPPSIIPVGGLHTKRAKSLPQDLQTYLDNSKNGVIVFSLGTNVRSDKLSEAKQKVLLSAFAKLKQNIIWKFETDIKNLPKNVIVRKFLPQNDLLGHPNVKLLINHGGALSTQEAMYHGLPIIGIPFFGDQRSNVRRVINRKLGLELVFSTLSTKDVYETITEVLTNPIYRRNAQLVSQRYKDRPDNALDRAVFWVEHVLREKGAPHLSVAARNMPFYQTTLLDIWLFVAAVIAISTATGYLVLRMMWRKMTRTSKIKKQ